MLYRTFFFSIAALILIIFSPLARADVNSQSILAIADKQATIDKAGYDLAKKQFDDLRQAKQQQFRYLDENGISHSVLSRAQLDFIAAQAAVQGANIALTDTKQALTDTENTIHLLEKNLQQLILLARGKHANEDRMISVEADLEFQRRLQQIQMDRIQTLSAIKSIAQQRLIFETHWQQQLQQLYASQMQNTQRNQLSQQLAYLQQDHQGWLNKLAGITQELRALTQSGQINDVSLKRLQLQSLEAEENVALIRLKSYLVHTQDRIQLFDSAVRSQKTASQLNDLRSQVAAVSNQLQHTEQFMTSKIHFLTMKKNELTTEMNRRNISELQLYGYSAMLSDLIHSYHSTISQVDALQSKVTHHQEELKHQLQNQLSERQTFPSDLTGWVVLAQKLVLIPSLLWNTLSGTGQQLIQEFSNLSSLALNGVSLSMLMLFGTWLYARRLLLNMEISVKKEKKRFSANLVYILLELGRRNIGSMLIFLTLVGLTFVLDITAPLLIHLLVVYLCFKVAMSIAKLTLLENIDDTSNHSSRAYSLIRRSLILGFLLSNLVVMCHDLPVAYEAKIFVNRWFMVFILIIAIQLFKLRRVIPNYFASLAEGPRRYFYRILQVLSLLIPISLLSNALVGLLGYVELAWAVAGYQMTFVMVLAGYLFARGLLIDGIEYLSEWLISRVSQGWLWAEAVLKPLDKVCRVVLFVLSVIFTLHLYQLDDNKQFLNLAEQILYEKIFAIGGNTINALLLCELFVIISLIRWLARWSREFSYRWLYAKAKDLGVRNSLAIFTQYASVIISILIGLNLLGIDLRGFTVVAAAFAAGIGFGMRDLITNFFSGILLLIERPFRTGDIVTLGTYEGEVIQTGMRSMTIRTWDHMEVIVPNSDMFTKPFVNWTHHDNIVRSVITLKIHREDDPRRVQKLIFDVLSQLKSVAKEPAPEVAMNEISESLIEMQVRYYVLLTVYRTRAAVRSEVLFAIWECFKEHHIRAPYPQYDLKLKDSQERETVSIESVALID